jgi:SAM-dependent methyltransferase
VKPGSIERLRCTRCLAEGVETGFHLDLARDDETGDVLEGFLVCRRCRGVRPVVQGIAVVPPDVEAHLRSRGNVYRRAVVSEPRLARYLLGRVGEGADVVPFEEVVARYGDLVSPAGSPDPLDRSLDAALRERSAEGPALDVGCGVGRSTFVLAARCGDAIGCDRSDARVRRARHVLTASEFLLPAAGKDEAPLDLSRLERADADFLVADAHALPFGRGTFRTIALRGGDGEGPWRDAGEVRRECERALAAGGTLLVADVVAGTWSEGVAGVAAR